MIYLLIFLGGGMAAVLVLGALWALLWLAENPRVKMPWRTPGDGL